MSKLSRLSAIIGLTLLGIGLIFAYARSHTNLPTYQLLDNYLYQVPWSDNGGCQPGPKLKTELKTTKSKPIISENDSLSINAWEENGCKVMFSIIAPNFDVNPSLVDPLYKSSSSWVLTPRKSGDFQVVVEIADATGAAVRQNISISVRDIFGLSPLQARVVSYIGTFLGPIGTLPWWYEQWQKRKVKNKPRKKRPE